MSEGSHIDRAPLCWTQHWHWLRGTPQVRGGGPSNLLEAVPTIPAGLTVPAVRAALSRLIDRHEALRTVYRLDDGGLPEQQVLPTLTPNVTVVDIDPDPDRTVRLADNLPRRFDQASQCPLSAVVGTSNGTVRSLLLGVAEIAVDGVAMAVLSAELEELLLAAATGRSPRLAAASPGPIERALGEQSGDGERAGAQALRYWREVLRSAPHSTLPFYWGGMGSGGTSVETQFVSRRYAEVAAAVADGHRTTPPTLFLSLLAVVLSGWTGHTTCHIGSVGSNRWMPELAASVGRYANIVSVIIDLAGDPPFSEIVRRAFVAQVTAYCHGHHDVGEFVMAAARESLGIGARFTTAVDLEYHYTPRKLLVHDGQPASGAQALDCLTEGFHQVPDPTGTQKLEVQVHPAGEYALITVAAPTTLLPEPAARLFLRQLMAILDAVAAGGDPRLSELTRMVSLPAYWHGPEWLSLRQSWISRHDVADLLARHERVATAAIFPEEVTTGSHQRAVGLPRLVAYVVAEAGVTPGELGEHMRDLVSHHPSAMVPRRYVICRSAPSDLADPHAWGAAPVLSAGTGQSTGPEVPVTPAEAALAAAFQVTHSLPVPRMGSSYAAGQGQFLRIPAMLEQLERTGYVGVRYIDLIGMASLRQLAKKIHTVA